jgi:tRNA dimethylallyltransferase
MDKKWRVLCIMGPTASGKSDLALRLAKRLGGEIVSIDAMMVYRGLDIGTAKPTEAERAICPHHLIDVVDPSADYSVAHCVSDAWSAIQSITERNHVPILVGGTMMYFDALLHGLSALPSTDKSIRLALHNQLLDEGLSAVWSALKLADPRAAQQIHPHDTQRIIRALEVFRATGRSLVEWHAQGRSKLPLDPLVFALMPPSRSWLWDRIESRMQQMLSHGWVEEVQGLLAYDPLLADSSCLRSIGYRQIVAHLKQGNASDLAGSIFVATRRYAKRQKTWLRHWNGLQALNPEDPEVLAFIESSWLRRLAS